MESRFQLGVRAERLTRRTASHVTTGSNRARNESRDELRRTLRQVKLRNMTWSLGNALAPMMTNRTHWAF